MKRLAVVLLAVVLGIALLCLGATEKLVNRSGSPAAGVALTFSEAVRITSYDKSVFPNQSPASGEAESFTFSGGTLPAGGTFQVTWSPSSARARSIKWIMAGLPAVAATSLPTIPTTYEEIMAQIAHYPGPEESLYVPAEGETIWLTDLEGHKDIYDNDSIRINYAPGFDKNQITRIEVYRNGIKMRFLPEKLDVLTNEQMKTFDGNPLERTPKSSHSDHAIFGYEYEFKMTTGTSTKLIAFVPVVVHNAVRFAGQVLAMPGHDFFDRLHLSDELLLTEFAKLKEQGVTGIQISVNNFTSSPTASSVFSQYTADPQICAAWKRTATDDELQRILGLASRAGLSSELHIQLWHTNENGGATAQEIQPRDLTAWFDSYGALCVRYAQLAQSVGVDILAVGVELNSMEKYADQWGALVARVRSTYSGLVTFAEATHHRLLGYSCFSPQLWAEKEKKRFWDCFDMIGVNCWTPPIATTPDPKLSDMLSRFVAFWASTIEYYRATYPGKPIWFIELGARDYDGAALAAEGYWDDQITGRQLDQQEFADIWGSYIAGAACLAVDGLPLWNIELDPARLQPFVGQFTVTATPAFSVVESFLEKE